MKKSYDDTHDLGFFAKKREHDKGQFLPIEIAKYVTSRTDDFF